MRVVGLPSSFYQLSRRGPPQLIPVVLERMRWLNCWHKFRELGL